MSGSARVTSDFHVRRKDACAPRTSDGPDTTKAGPRPPRTRFLKRLLRMPLSARRPRPVLDRAQLELDRQLGLSVLVEAGVAHGAVVLRLADRLGDGGLVLGASLVDRRDDDVGGIEGVLGVGRRRLGEIGGLDNPRSASPAADCPFP